MKASTQAICSPLRGCTPLLQILVVPQLKYEFIRRLPGGVVSTYIVYKYNIYRPGWIQSFHMESICQERSTQIFSN